MEQIQLDNIDINASRIGLGTWAIGGWMWGGTDEKESIRTIHTAFDKGINLIDTAPVYGFGKAEEIIGKAMKEHGKRDDILLATKTGIDWIDDEPFRNGSRKKIQEDIDNSLRRMQTDYIDILQIHWPDPQVPIYETAETMDYLLKQGKIRAIGVSNFTPEEMDIFREAAPLHTIQPPYNLFEREIEKDLLPYVQKHELSSLTYGSLCRGLLSGKMTADWEFNGDDLRKLDPKFQQPRYGQYLKAVKELDELAQDRFSKRVIHLALKWVIQQPGASIALMGARKPEQLDPIDGLDFHIDDKTMHEIDEILLKHIQDPVGPGFMAPPDRQQLNLK
ncbi:aldo/keto reductase [Thalassobacillus pellis]|uniref:aldo/keto reductase n=1 Tax=Thalassobacillus pellis TaxID=748008 RepID=UPI001961CB9B|nr:aldo/keto reductase [Thalassobacillus pellis]MBM7553010.1 aryl-alcohol dehydrogenase-like predicted oxidoreductase [Thalassobacillus pellis]